MLIRSAIEIIGDLKYIVERDEKGVIICQHLYNKPAITPPPAAIELSKVTQENGKGHMEFIINEPGTYKLIIGEVAKQVVGIP